MSRKYLSSFVAIAATLILASCSKEGKETPSPTPPTPSTQPDKVSVKGYSHIAQEDTIVMHPNVINVQEDINNQFSSITPEGTLVYNETSALDKVHVGDILYSSGADAGSHAYARKVVSIEKRGGKVYYQTEQATITEVFKNVDTSQEYKLDLANIQIHDVQEQIEQIRAAKYGKAYAERMRALEHTIPLGDRAKAKVKVEDGDLKLYLDYILYDHDGKVKETTNDQLKLSLDGLKVNNFSCDYKLHALPPRLDVKTVIPMTIPLALKYGFSLEDEELEKQNQKMSKGAYADYVARKKAELLEGLKHKSWLKREILENHSDIPKHFYAETLKDIVGKRIWIATIAGLPVDPVGGLIADARIDVFFILEASINGKIKVRTELTPTIYSSVSVLPSPVPMMPLIILPTSAEIRGMKFRNASIEGEIELEGKAGLGIAGGLYFKAFQKGAKHPKDLLKPENQSHLTVNADLYIGLNAKMDGEITYDRLSSETSGHLGAAASVGIYTDVYFEYALYLWKLLENEGKLKINDEPIAILGPVGIEGGFIYLNEGQTYKLKARHKRYSLPNIFSPKAIQPEYLSTDPKVFTAKVDKETGDLEIQAKSEGIAMLDLWGDGGSMSKGWGAYRVIVYKSYKRHGAVQVDNSQGTEI